MADPQNTQGNTVVVYDPSGIPHDIPEEQLHDAVKLGKGMPAVWMERPGEPGNRYPIPADQVNDAVKSGGKVLPFEQQDVKHPGFWASMDEDLNKPISIGGEVDPALTHAKDLAVSMARNMGNISVAGIGTKMYRAITAKSPLEERAASQELKNTAGDIVMTGVPMMVGEPGEVPPRTQEVTRPEAPTPKPPAPEGVLGRVAEVAKRRVMEKIPGVKAAKDLDYILRGSEENAPPTPKAPIPAVPPEWGQGRYGTPVSQWGQRVTPETSSIPFGQSTQSIGHFSIADAPPRVVLQAVDELGPNATHDQIAQRVQEIETKLSPAEQKVVAEGAKQGLFKQLAAKQYVHPNVENFGLDLTKAPEKPIDTDAYAKATAQARTEKPTASTEEVIARRNEILREQGVEAPKGDIGEQSRKDIKGPTREETRAAAAAREGQTPSQYPPPAPETKLQPTKPTPQDVAETANIREQVRQAAEREGRSALREARGEYAQRNDVSLPKGTMTGAAGEGNDVSLADRSEQEPPEAKQLPDIEDISQAARQLSNLQKAGASKNAIAEFERRAEVRFGLNWKHIAGQVDALRQIHQKSAENFPQNP